MDDSVGHWETANEGEREMDENKSRDREIDRMAKK